MDRLELHDPNEARTGLLRRFLAINSIDVETRVGRRQARRRRCMLMARLLAFDTSGERVHVGVSVHGDVWIGEEAGGAQASARLLPCIQRVLGAAGVAMRELDAIAFGRGPGAFTGLRAACATAQGLAWGANLPVLPIDTLMAVAEDARVRLGADDVWVAMDARMGEIFAGRYRWSGTGWLQIVAPALVTPDEFHALGLTHPAKWLVGSAPKAFGERLRWHSASELASDADDDAQPAGGALLACAKAAWARSEAIDAAGALPLYLRNKVALTTAERDAGTRFIA